MYQLNAAAGTPQKEPIAPSYWHPHEI